MSRQLPPLNALRAFEAAGRHQSFSRAAQELRVSHSSISRHVRGLEDRLGVQLFRDHARGIKLSPDGAAYLTRISPALDAIAEATEGLTQAPEGAVTVNCEPLFASKWLIPRMQAFQELFPQVDVRLEASMEIADIVRYEADVAIRFVSQGATYTEAALISDAMLRPYAAPSLISAPVTDLAQLLSYPLLRDRRDWTWARWFQLSNNGAPIDLPAPAWRMSAELSYEAALAGQGVILVTDEVAACDVAAGRLNALSDIGFRDGGYFELHADGALRRKPVRVFRDWLFAQTACWRSVAYDSQPNG
ncbi:DNA-binding transcriptional LysR family regulator [Sulfitobacter undariae]|uniref:DNA-binding transcriptional LysR family regulator n=1 Tax=Sulfitobacter undariae TaxID=1563671 RepID=A0A7W6H0F4_9RHOB|nr:LysR family transcriptional regulator [Sulfitobacter undariae]MBB3992614.1 DNA-binding transcriptional LysR family regulator [Sulfitobacter undariae]